MWHIKKVRRQELVIYLLIWGVLFLIPPIAYYADPDNVPAAMGWRMIGDVWLGFVPFLVLFAVHDSFAARLLLHAERRKYYPLCLSALLVLFLAWQIIAGMDNRHRRIDGEPTPPELREKRACRECGKVHNAGMHHHKKLHDKPFRRPLNPIMLINFVIAVTMCGLNVGVKLYLKSQHDEAHMKELERQNLKHEIAYLKYQINPHFFMNTLNNIHALVDISPEEAKKAIIELSVLMRYMLYEGAEQTVPLAHELDFLRHYIALMKLRYTEKVDIKVSFPELVDNAFVPPLLLVTFVENAFKHGVSYRVPSFVHVRVEVKNGQLHFACTNSLVKRTAIEGGGIGLENTNKRLKLIYGDRYTLHINRGQDTYNVLLIIPLNYD